MKVKAVKMIAITNDIFDKVERHYLTIFVECMREDPSQMPEVRPITRSCRRVKNLTLLPEPRTEQVRRLGLEGVARD